MKPSSLQMSWSAFVCAVAALLVGCSTQVSVKELSVETVKAGDAVDGLPFHTLQRYWLDLYRRDGEQYVKVVQDQLMATLADLNRVYLYSRRIVGWSMSDTMQAKMVSDALLMALWHRGKPSRKPGKTHPM